MEVLECILSVHWQQTLFYLDGLVVSVNLKLHPGAFWGQPWSLDSARPVKVPFSGSSCDENILQWPCKTTPAVAAVEMRLMWASQHFLTHRSVGTTILVKQMWRPTSLSNSQPPGSSTFTLSTFTERLLLVWKEGLLMNNECGERAN